MVNKRDTDTMTVGSLIIQLINMPKNYKVYLGSDSEGNSYSSLDSKWSFQYDDDDKVIALMPFVDHLDDADIMPKQYRKIMKEIREERLGK